MRAKFIAAIAALFAAFFSAPSPALAATISASSFDYSTRSAWDQLIEAESSAVTKSGSWTIFNVGTPAPWNSGLWITSNDSYAQVTFSVPAPTLLIQFESDSNDGTADFIVDNISVGTLNTYNGGWFQVVIGGLSNSAHTLRVRAQTHDLAIDAFGAVAAATPLPASFPLFAAGLGALALIGWSRKKKAAALAA